MTDYSSYSLDELYDVYNHVNREKYPDIFDRIKAEIQKRELKDISEISVEDTLNNLKNISNIDSWFNELNEQGIHLNEKLKVLIRNPQAPVGEPLSDMFVFGGPRLVVAVIWFRPTIWT